VWNAVLSAVVRINEELLERKVARKVEVVEQKNFVDKWRSISRYSSLAD
jgi:hypothetical protein